MKFDIWRFYENLFRMYKLHQNMTRMKANVHEDKIAFRFWGASSPLCWFINTEYCVLHVHTNPTVFHPAVQYVTTTCFGHISGSSSGCDLNHRAAMQGVWGVLLGYWVWVGGTRSRCFNSPRSWYPLLKQRDLVVSTVLGHGTHYWNNEISFPSLFPPPNPQNPQRTPHTSCIAAL